MDAPCKIQGSIHVFRLVNNMCPGKWVHISFVWYNDIGVKMKYLFSKARYVVFSSPHCGGAYFYIWVIGQKVLLLMPMELVKY